jgi:hypothetical protein
MKRIHDLFDRGGPIPPVHVQDIDIRGAQFLEGCLDGDVEGLCMIPGVIHLVGDVILASLIVGCVLVITLAYLICGHATRGVERTLVEMTSWSRMPRFSAHSPMNSSEVSS